MRPESFDFLQSLIATPSPSGHEAAGQRLWSDTIRPYVDDLSMDAYSNVVAKRNVGGAPHIMIAAHMDEIGLIVNHIDDRGFLKVQKIGGVNPLTLVGRQARVQGIRESLPGVIGTAPIHLKRPDDNAIPKVEDLWIDIGATDRDEARARVQVGATATVEQSLEQLTEHRVCGRGLDNRSGCWIVAETARRLAAIDAPVAAEVAFVSNVMEEIGTLGIRQVTAAVKPDAIIALDVTHSMDFPGADPAQFADIALGKGPVLTIGGLNHPSLVRGLEAAAHASSIDIQREAAGGRTGTDADDAFWMEGGIPTAVVGLPTRYMHSPTEVVDLRDMDQIADLLVAWVVSLNGSTRFDNQTA